MKYRILLFLIVSSLCLSSCVCMPTDGDEDFWIVGPFGFFTKRHYPDYTKSKKNQVAIEVLKKHGFSAGANTYTDVMGARGDQCVAVNFKHYFLFFGTKISVGKCGGNVSDAELKNIADEIRRDL